MTLYDVCSEGDLREWLHDNIHYCEGRLRLERIEPSMYGSSIGAPDFKIICESKVVGLELKYLLKTRKGIKWTVRPAQRRYHHMLARKNGRSALLAYVSAEEKLLLVRGDKIPLRDYASDIGSSCINGQVESSHVNWSSIQMDAQSMIQLETFLFHDESFWR